MMRMTYFVPTVDISLINEISSFLTFWWTSRSCTINRIRSLATSGDFSSTNIDCEARGQEIKQ